MSIFGNAGFENMYALFLRFMKRMITLPLAGHFPSDLSLYLFFERVLSSSKVNRCFTWVCIVENPSSSSRTH